MAKNPYLNKKGVFNYRKWLNDAQGQYKLDDQFINYATSAGYRLGWDRDSTASPGTARRQAGTEVGTFQLRNASAKGRNSLRPSIGLYGPAGGGSGSGGGSGGSAGARGGGGSGGGGMSDLDRTIANLLEGIGGEMTSYAAGNADLLNRVTKSNNKLLKRIAKNKDTTKMLRGELASSRETLNTMTSRFEDRFAQQQSEFSSQLTGLRAAADEARNNFQRLLDESYARLETAQQTFQERMQESEANRLAMQQNYEEQLRQTRALVNAYVPQMEETAVAPRLGDERSTQQIRRPRQMQSVSSLSIATPSSLQIA